MTNVDLKGMRSLLFVPADRADRFDKALASGADGVIVDLEDAVAPARKQFARETLARWLALASRSSVLVRVNGVDSKEHREDVALCGAEGVSAIVLPKAEDSGAIAAVHAASRKPLLPIVETARGLGNLRSIATATGVVRLCLGKEDLTVDMALDSSASGAAAFMDHARYEIAMESRIAGLAAPVDGVHIQIDDIDGLRRSAKHAAGFGFCGMLAIHPRQVAAINEVFTPRAEEVSWASAVLAEAAGRDGVGAFSYQGIMIDGPVLQRARLILKRAGMPGDGG